MQFNKSFSYPQHDFYQYFLRLEDADLQVLFTTLTDLPEEQITEILQEHQKQPEKRKAQEVLAGRKIKRLMRNRGNNEINSI